MVGVREAEKTVEREKTPEVVPDAVGESVPLLVWLSWLAVTVLLTVAEKEGKLPVPGAVTVALSEGEWVVEVQELSVSRGDVEEVREDTAVELPEETGETVPLLVWLAWLAEKVVLVVAEREGQLAVAGAERVALSEGV